MSDERAKGPLCPECGCPGRVVGLKTVKHLLDYRRSHAATGEGWLFCADPECDVYYFRIAAAAQPAGTGPDDTLAAAGQEVFRAADIKDRARPRARGADRLVCYCFGHTVGDIAADARAGRNEIPGAIAAEVRAGMCACEVLNPGGG